MWIKVVCLNFRDRCEVLGWAFGNFFYENIYIVFRVKFFFVYVNRDYFFNIENL